MSKAAVFVLSSAWEGFGNVLVEAMAVGTPVVATNCPSGPAEILENGKYGQLVKVGDAEAMAEGILAELEGSTNSELLQHRARQFSYDKIADQYLELLHARD
jgi:glycosyltransferase involved in cell wall biosynthesis